MMNILEYMNWICFAAVLGVAVWQDIRLRKIKNEVNVAGVLLGIFFAAILPEREILPAILGFFVVLVVGIICWNLKFFRAGDAKLLCVAGAFLEWKMALNVLLLAVVCGAVLGAPFVVWRLIKKEEKKEKEGTKFPFSVAIALACVLGLKFGYVWELLTFM